MITDIAKLKILLLDNRIITEAGLELVLYFLQFYTSSDMMLLVPI